MPLCSVSSGENPKTQFSACVGRECEGRGQEEAAVKKGTAKEASARNAAGRASASATAQETSRTVVLATPEPHALLAPETTRQANNRVRSKCTTAYRESAGIAGCRRS